MTDKRLSEDFTALYSVQQYLSTEFSTSGKNITVLHGWPEPNCRLKHPSITIDQVGDSNIENHRPTLLKYEEVDGSDVDLRALYSVGDIQLQVVAHLWGKNKSQVGQLHIDLDNAINKSSNLNIDNPTGLQLELIGYYGVKAKYEIERYRYIKGEAETQRGEYRMDIFMSCHFDKVREIIVPKMKVIDLQIEVGTSLP